MGCLYEATNKIDGKVYVGITTGTLDERIKRHFRDARPGASRMFQRALLKYGKDAFEWRSVVEDDCWFFLCWLERFRIDEHRANCVALYNMTDGGDGIFGYIKSAEQRKAFADIMRGRKHSSLARKNMAAAARLRRHSDHTKAKISDFRTGTTASDTTKEKMSASQKRRRDYEKSAGITVNRARGEMNKASVLTEIQVVEIVKKLDSGSTAAKLTREYGVSQCAIDGIKFGRTWRHLTAAAAAIRKPAKKRGTKLTEHQAKEVLHRVNAGEMQKRIAKDMNISEALVSMIKSGKAWAEQHCKQ